MDVEAVHGEEQQRDRTTRPAFRPRSYHPPWWLSGAHGQIIVGRILRSVVRVPSLRVRMGTPDGDFLDVDIPRADLEPDSRSPPRGPSFLETVLDQSNACVVLLHGLEGCSRSGYMQVAARRLLERGVQPLSMNFRSCSGEPNRTKRFYHSGDTADLRTVLHRIRQSHQDLPVGVVGFSLGGNVLLKYLGEAGVDSPTRPDAAVAVSVPYGLSAGAREIERGWNRVYGRYFVRSLKSKVRKKIRRGFRFDERTLASVETLRDFDDAFTAPIHGFDDAEQYYCRADCRQWLSRVRVPTLVVQARDDPFVAPGELPERALASNPWIEPAVTDRGGHLGFVDRVSVGRLGFWSEDEAARFLARRLVDRP